MDTNTTKNGQAAIEFVITLIALMLIVSGGIFLFELNTAQRDMTTTLRAKAGDAALDGFTTTTAPYIRDWDDGNDDRSGTADDKPMNGHAGVFNTLAGYGAADDPADWDRLQTLISTAAPKRDMPSFQKLRQNPMPMSSLDFVERKDSTKVTTDRVVRQLLLNKDAITVTHEVWLPSCSELY